ncbi:hypothetical protein N0V90_010394 [Kalmusia sp. IMI 367209]|nr:hypothetical protein N0V90_010394 [Kalmusia sp. IMI 367209]
MKTALSQDEQKANGRGTCKCEAYQCPANRGVAAEAPPAEKKVCVYLLASYEGSKDDEDGGAGIVGELQEDNLG